LTYIHKLINNIDFEVLFHNMFINMYSAIYTVDSDVGRHGGHLSNGSAVSWWRCIVDKRWCRGHRWWSTLSRSLYLFFF